ncbi:polysaccharide deacetylase family protein [Methylobacterium persicinum]|uniref:Chitooligosaccharide deacetylase n=1 Tax=Methylobacterium persicinum TaxID=374426 RepID=A0ABU0HPP5_9HYPH|nr:polysaccharide deacetylase family protein [Methylobacterium persicinum]MDQ0443695.1 peptidoglycan/xylan/chitin deacetylase (PgdA/CDA1 family) [Methylobacterium persicinum]GJE40178.1 hypothetical protein KHHGKMAE_4268 [Methylobacterium persicinum]
MASLDPPPEPAPPSWNHRFYAAGFQAIVGLAAHRWLAPLARGRGIVLAFHHVRPWRKEAFTPNRFLEITPAFLEEILDALDGEGFEVVPLSDVPGRLAAPRTGRPFAALTFDDGYRDVIEHAWPILARRGVPWAMFVTGDFADGRGRLWWRELELAVARLDGIAPEASGLETWLDTCGPAAKARAYRVLYGAMMRGTEDALLDRTRRLAEAAGVDVAGIVPTLCADWDELRRLAADPSVTFGSHTLSHAILAKRGTAEARTEIAESRKAIADRLGRPVDHIAYPLGGPREAGPREFSMARDSGYAIGLTTRPGHVGARHRSAPTALPRVSMNGHHQTGAALLSLLSGVPFVAHDIARAARRAAAPRAGDTGTHRETSTGIGAEAETPWT